MAGQNDNQFEIITGLRRACCRPAAVCAVAARTGSTRAGTGAPRQRLRQFRRSARPRAAAGASAIRLPGGSSQSISWQPVSVERDKGVNVAAGIAAIPSKYQHWKMRPCRRHGSLQALAREATPRCDGDTVCDGDRSCDAAGHAWTDREGLSRPIRLPPRYTAVWLSNRIPLTKQVAAGSIDSDSSRSKGGFLP